MNKRFIGVLLFAFLVATGGGLITWRALAGKSSTAKAAVPMNRIIVAAHDMEPGVILKEVDLKTTDWPGALPTGASPRIQDYVGRGVLTAIYAREPIMENRLAAKGAGGGLAVTIPQGMRAFAVRVNDVVGVAGFVVPGMRVDVLINGNSPSGNPLLGTLARTLMQNVEVLSAGQDFKRDAEGKPVVSQVVTLLVTPEQAEKLSLAANQTTIQLVLRNPLDREPAKVPGSALAYLFEGANRPPVAARPAPAVKAAPVIQVVAPAKETPFKMEIITGTKKLETQFSTGSEGK